MISYFLFRILKQDEQKSASHGRAIQQRHQQLTRHNYNQEEAANYESDFESESRRTEVKEVRLSECQPGPDDSEEEEEARPVSEITDEVSKVSRGGEEVLYSDTFSDLSSSFTPRSADHTGGRSSRSSRSRDDRSERRDSARKHFKDAVVQTQLAPPTSSWTAGQCASPDRREGPGPLWLQLLCSVSPLRAGLSPAGGQTFPDPTPVITHLSAEAVEGTVKNCLQSKRTTT